MLVTTKGLEDNIADTGEFVREEGTDNEKLDLLKSISFNPDNYHKCKLRKFQKE